MKNLMRLILNIKISNNIHLTKSDLPEFETRTYYQSSSFRKTRNPYHLSAVGVLMKTPTSYQLIG